VSASVETSVSPLLDAAALEAALSWQFSPARRDGKAVPAKVRAIVRFARSATDLRDARRAAGHQPAQARPVSSPAVAPGAPVTVTVEGMRAPPPRSASELTQERPVLSAAPHRTASDLLLTVPGIALTQHSGEGSAHQIFFRGFDAEHGQDMEIWAGGAPVNDVSNVHGQGYADLNFLPPEVVSRIRSAPGTYDPRQGDFSVAGSLWLDLGYAEPGVTARASAGQFGARRYFLAYHPEGWSEQTFAAFEHYSTNGFGPSRAARRSSVVSQVAFDLGAVRLRLMASTYVARFDSPGVLRLSDITSGRVNRFDSYDEHQGGDAARTQLVAALESGEPDSRLSLAPYVVLHSMRLREDYTGYLAEPFTGTAAEVAAADHASEQGNSEQQLNDAASFGFTASYSRRLKVFDPRDTFEAGVSARYDRIAQSQKKLSLDTSQVTLDELDAKVQGTDTAGYIDLALHPLGRVALRGGLRIDGLAYVTEDDGGQGQGQRRAAQGAHLGKKAMLDVRLLGDLHAIASYGDGFRSPQARSLKEGENAPFTTVQSYEFGMRYGVRRFSSSASLFRTLLSDDLAFNQVTARNERTPPTRRTGASLELRTQPTRWLTSSVSITYTRAELTNTDAGFAAGDLLPYAPQLVVRADTAFTPTLGEIAGRPLRLHVGVGQTGIAWRPLPFGEMGHDVYLMDVTVSARLREVELGVSAYNLLDAAWYDGEYTFASNFERGASPTLVPQRHVTVGAPRSVLGTLSFYL
jgi:hypothetical protein